MTEKADQQARKLNLVIFSLPEADSAEEDTAQIKTLFESKMNIQDEIVITEINRLGRTKPDGNPRLVKITLENLNMKRKILASATKLRNIPHDDKYAKVYVKPDLTKKQQAESKNLSEALKQKRLSDPTNQYIISKGTIIIKPTTDPPTEATPVHPSD